MTITMAHGPNPAIEQNLRSVFATVVASASVTEPKSIAALVNGTLGRGFSATLEAERRSWSRYRISVRVQGVPITIATVEVMLPE